MTFVRSFHDHPLFISWLSRARCGETLATLDDAARAHPTVLFTAHSLPVRTLTDGSQRCKTCDCDDSCRYRDGLQATADLVAADGRSRGPSDRLAVGRAHRRPLVGTGDR